MSNGKDSNSYMSRSATYAVVLMIVLFSVILGYAFVIFKDLSVAPLFNLVFVLLAVPLLINIVDMIGLLTGRLIKLKYSVRIFVSYVFASVFLFGLISSTIISGLPFMIVSILLVVSILNMVTARLVELSADVSNLSKLFELGETTTISFSGHRYIVMYLGVFIATTVCGVFGWLSIRGNGNSDGLVSVLMMTPFFLTGTVFTIMSLIVFVDTYVGKYCMREYRDRVVVEKKENEDGEIEKD